MIPYSNPLPPKPPEPVKAASPPVITREPSPAPVVKIQVPRQPKPKQMTLALDQDLTARVQAFADAQGLPNLNEGIRILLRAALSSDPVLSAMGSGWQRGFWEGRMAFFAAASGFIEDHRKVIMTLQQEASLYTPQNPIHIPGEQPPTW